MTDPVTKHIISFGFRDGTSAEVKQDTIERLEALHDQFPAIEGWNIDTAMIEDKPDPVTLEEIAAIPPITILLNGANYGYSNRTDPAYKQFRANLKYAMQGSPSPSQVGRVAAKIAKGDLRPRDNFSLKRQKGLSYDGQIQTDEDLGRFNLMGTATARYVLDILTYMTNVPPLDPIVPIQLPKLEPESA